MKACECAACVGLSEFGEKYSLFFVSADALKISLAWLLVVLCTATS